LAQQGRLCRAKLHDRRPLPVKCSPAPCFAQPDPATLLGTMKTKPSLSPWTTAEGGCGCKALRYQLTARPLFVHCCHCRWCQRETGTAFALNALIESDQVSLLTGAPLLVDTPSNRPWTENSTLPHLPCSHLERVCRCRPANEVCACWNARQPGSATAGYPYIYRIKTALGTTCTRRARRPGILHYEGVLASGQP
jgi:hypothetical protein